MLFRERPTLWPPTVAAGPVRERAVLDSVRADRLSTFTADRSLAIPSLYRNRLHLPQKDRAVTRIVNSDAGHTLNIRVVRGSVRHRGLQSSANLDRGAIGGAPSTELCAGGMTREINLAAAMPLRPTAPVVGRGITPTTFITSLEW